MTKKDLLGLDYLDTIPYDPPNWGPGGRDEPVPADLPLEELTTNNYWDFQKLQAVFGGMTTRRDWEGFGVPDKTTDKVLQQVFKYNLHSLGSSDVHPLLRRAIADIVLNVADEYRDATGYDMHADAIEGMCLMALELITCNHWMPTAYQPDDQDAPSAPSEPRSQ